MTDDYKPGEPRAEERIRASRDADASSNRVRDEAVRAVDARHGYTVEYAPDPEAHRAEYDEEERRVAWMERHAIPNSVSRHVVADAINDFESDPENAGKYNTPTGDWEKADAILASLHATSNRVDGTLYPNTGASATNHEVTQHAHATPNRAATKMSGARATASRTPDRGGSPATEGAENPENDSAPSALPNAQWASVPRLQRHLQYALTHLERLQSYSADGDYNHDRAIDAAGYVRSALEELGKIRA